VIASYIHAKTMKLPLVTALLLCCACSLTHSAPQNGTGKSRWTFQNECIHGIRNPLCC